MCETIWWQKDSTKRDRETNKKSFVNFSLRFFILFLCFCFIFCSIFNFSKELSWNPFSPTFLNIPRVIRAASETTKLFDLDPSLSKVLNFLSPPINFFSFILFHVLTIILKYPNAVVESIFENQFPGSELWSWLFSATYIDGQTIKQTSSAASHIVTFGGCSGVSCKYEVFWLCMHPLPLYPFPYTSFSALQSFKNFIIQQSNCNILLGMVKVVIMNMK